MNRITLVIFSLLLFWPQVFCQDPKKNSADILVNGLVMDSESHLPLPGTQIFINRKFYSAADGEGRFAFSLSGTDTVLFTRTGYMPANLIAGDTLAGKEYVAGIFMNQDTIKIGEVIIMPRLSGLRSYLMNPGPAASTEHEYAKYNLAVSSYQARAGQGKLGDPDANYNVLRHKQKLDAYSKGQIPDDQIAALSPLMLIPAAWLLINGLPEKPPPFQPRLTDQEIDRILKRYLEITKK